MKNIHPWKIFTPYKYSTLKNFHQNIHPQKYSPLKRVHPLKMFTPRKYSLLENIHLWKICTTEKYSALIMHNLCLFLCLSRGIKNGAKYPFPCNKKRYKLDQTGQINYIKSSIWIMNYFKMNQIRCLLHSTKHFPKIDWASKCRQKLIL